MRLVDQGHDISIINFQRRQIIINRTPLFICIIALMNPSMLQTKKYFLIRPLLVNLRDFITVREI